MFTRDLPDVSQRSGLDVCFKQGLITFFFFLDQLMLKPANIEELMLLWYLLWDELSLLV